MLVESDWYPHINAPVKNEDLVCFDEFHELQGNMILSESLLKDRRVILLSATPRPVEGLENAPTLEPEIKKKNKVHVYQFDMNPVSMYKEAMVRHPEASKRCLIIVHSYKAVEETIAGILELKPGVPVVEFSARTSHMKNLLNTFKTGRYVIVATQIIDAGYDVKPPPRLVIDSGKQIVVDRGQFVFPTPWSLPITAEQRWGRTGRNSDDQDGIVYAHSQSGTGKDAIEYPAGSLFYELIIAKFYKVPRLIDIKDPCVKEFPTFRIKSCPPETFNSLLWCYLSAMSGVSEAGLSDFYYQHVKLQRPLSEDYAWMENLMKIHRKPCGFLPYDLALTAMDRKPFVTNTSKGILETGLIWPVHGSWRESQYTQVDYVKPGLTPAGIDYEEALDTIRDAYEKAAKKQNLDPPVIDKLKLKRKLIGSVQKGGIIPEDTENTKIGESIIRYDILEDGKIVEKRVEQIGLVCSECRNTHGHTHPKGSLSDAKVKYIFKKPSGLDRVMY